MTMNASYDLCLKSIYCFVSVDNSKTVDLASKKKENETHRQNRLAFATEYLDFYWTLHLPMKSPLCHASTVGFTYGVEMEHCIVNKMIFRTWNTEYVGVDECRWTW